MYPTPLPQAIVYNGRVETYTHSDMTTKNKGSCIVRVDCQSEFGAKTDAFIAFCKRAAMLCYGAQSEIYEDVIAVFPELEQARLALEEVIKEKITIVRIVIVTLLKAVWEKEKPVESLFLRAKRIKLPLFEASPYTGVMGTLPLATEMRFDPIEKHKACGCGPNEVCVICSDTVNGNKDK